MKRSPLALTILLLLCFSAHAQTKSPDDGKLKDGVYYNLYFNFAFTHPKDWVVHEQATNERIHERALEEAAKTGNLAQQKNTYILLTVTQYPKGTPGITVNPAVFVVAEKVPVNADGKAYLLSLRQVRQEKKSDQPLLAKPEEFRVAGMQFFRDDYTGVVNGITKRQSIFVHVKKGYAIIFSFSGGDEKTVDEMATTMNSILPIASGGGNVPKNPQ